MRKEIEKNRGRGRKIRAAVLFSAVVLAALLGGCRTADSQETKAQSAEETGEEDLETQQVSGDASRMIEDGENLYFKYGSDICVIDRKTEEIKTVKSFGKANQNGSFWIYGGGLYFDEFQPGDGNGEDFYSLKRLDLETGKEEHLADLMSQPSQIYASDGCLYVKGYNSTIVYALDEEGKTNGELSPETTVYGKIPEGCRELFNGMLPYYVDQLGYMPVQNDTCLVIAEADGSNPRELSEITNTSSVLFAEDAFFVLFRDGNGITRCCRYDLENLEPVQLFETMDNPSLVQYRDGYLYYMVNRISGAVGSDVTFYRVAGMPDGAGSSAADESSEDAFVPETVLTVREDPGMTGDFLMYGNFYVTDDSAYCQQFQNYGVYMGVTELGGDGGVSLLNPVLFQSPVVRLGKVEAVSETVPCSCGEKTAGTLYAERLVFEGDDEAAAAMNQLTLERQEAVLAAGRASAVSMGEEWIHSDNYTPYSMTYVLDGENGITCLDDNYCSILMEGYEYAGGAHGTPFRDVMVFDRNTGKELGLSDITDNTQEELQQIVGAAFRALAEKTNFAFESPEALEHTVADSVSYDSPFYLSDDGVVFYYEPYAIAAYSEGFPEVVIPYEDLKMKIEISSGE